MRGRPPTIRAEDLLDAARDVFREEGHAATTAKIAQRAGVSEGILFYRYKSKEGLLAAVIHREIEPPASLRDLARAAGQRSVAENLERIIDAVLDSVLRAHPFLELAHTSAASCEIRRALFARAGKPPPQQIVELIAGYIDAEARAGRMRSVASLPAARAVFGGCVDYVRSREIAKKEGDRRTFVSGLVDVFLSGLAAPAPPRRSR